MPANKNINKNHGGEKGCSKDKDNNQKKNNSQGQKASSYSLSGNLGLLYTRRYYEDVTIEIIGDAKKQNEYYTSRNKNLIKQSKNVKYEVIMQPNDVDSFDLITCYPGLITGIGINHSSGHKNEVKLGLSFDHTTGLPYIPGSSVKGLLRSVFPSSRKSNNTDRRDFISDILNLKQKLEVSDLERLCEDIFGSDNKDKDFHKQGRDIFFDAFPVEAKSGLLDLDFITPHTSGEFSNPTPIQFMRIKEDVTFRFAFKLSTTKLSDGLEVGPSDKLELFEKILTTVGIGAKTNVGYGQLKIVD